MSERSPAYLPAVNGPTRPEVRAYTGTLREASESFLRSREASGCTAATLRTYEADLRTFAFWCLRHSVPDPFAPQTIQDYLADLRGRMKPVSAHRHYRALRTFTRWLHRTGRLSSDPMAEVKMRCPKTLPRVPTDDDVRRLLGACDGSFEGTRNRAMIALLADSALRKEELRRLRVGDVDMNTRTLHVVQGKGQRDGVSFFGDATASMLRAALAQHPDPRPGCFLFTTRAGVPLGTYAITRILHRLSRRAGLERPIGAHQLRHFAATAILRRTGNLELVRQVLRHSTLAMALRYATLTSTEVAAKFAVASPVDHLQGSLGNRAR